MFCNGIRFVTLYIMWRLCFENFTFCVQLLFVTLRHVTFTLCCFLLCSNIHRDATKRPFFYFSFINNATLWVSMLTQQQADNVYQKIRFQICQIVADSAELCENESLSVVVVILSRVAIAFPTIPTFFLLVILFEPRVLASFCIDPLEDSSGHRVTYTSDYTVSLYSVQCTFLEIHSHPQRALPPGTKGGHTRLRVRRWGSPNSGASTKRPLLRTSLPFITVLVCIIPCIIYSETKYSWWGMGLISKVFIISLNTMSLFFSSLMFAISFYICLYDWCK